MIQLLINKPFGSKRKLSKEEFLNDYVKGNVQSGAVYFLEPHVKDSKLPIHIDIDLEYNLEAKLDENELKEKYYNATVQILEILREDLNISQEMIIDLSCRPPYVKGNYMHAGFHLYISPRVSKKFMQTLRVNLINGDFQTLFGCINKPEDIFDKALFNRSNGLYLIGQQKWRSKQYITVAHKLFFHGVMK